LCARLLLFGRNFECTGAENAAPKSAAYSGLWQVFYITVYAPSTIQTLFARLRADMLAAKGSFITVIAPSALATLFARLGLAFQAPAALKMPPQTVSIGGGAIAPVAPPVDPPLALAQLLDLLAGFFMNYG